MQNRSSKRSFCLLVLSRILLQYQRAKLEIKWYRTSTNLMLVGKEKMSICHLNTESTPQFPHHLKLEMSELTLMAGGKSTSSVHGIVCYQLFQQLKRFQPNTEKPGLVHAIDTTLRKLSEAQEEGDAKDLAMKETADNFTASLPRKGSYDFSKDQEKS